MSEEPISEAQRGFLEAFDKMNERRKQGTRWTETLEGDRLGTPWHLDVDWTALEIQRNEGWGPPAMSRESRNGR
jgi:hypothetical protein